jgi:TonB family protein
MRSRGIEGNVMVELLVNPDGTAPLESVDFRWASGREFAQAIYDVVPKWTFSPLEIAGCKVASFVLMPVIFGLNR